MDDETENFEQDDRGSNEKGFTPTEKNEAPKAVVGKVLEDHGEKMVEQLVFMKTKPMHEKVKKRGILMNNMSPVSRVQCYILSHFQTKIYV